jgi:hypothetical protein
MDFNLLDNHLINSKNTLHMLELLEPQPASLEISFPALDESFFCHP